MVVDLMDLMVGDLVFSNCIPLSVD